jgi:hypothetical protein
MPTSPALQLRDIWADLVSKSSRKDGRLRLDVYSWLGKVALDIIGLAGDSIATDLLLATLVTHFEWHQDLTTLSIHCIREMRHRIPSMRLFAPSCQ